MYNILFALNGIMSNGGTESVVMNIFNHIDKTQFHIDFLIHGTDTRSNSTHDNLEKAGASIFYVTPRYISYRQNVADISGVLSKKRFDIVHSHMDASGYFVLHFAKKMGITTRIAHSHNTASQFPSSRTAIYNLPHRLLLEYAKYGLRRESTHFIACSKAAGLWLFGENICNSANYLLYKNGIDLEKYLYNDDIRKNVREDLGVKNNFVIGHVGRFAKQKNHTFLIDMFKELYKLHPASKLLLVGEGELLPQIKERVRNYNLPSEAVIFAGARDDVNRLYQAMDIMLLPSLFEGLPVVMVEAQASGLKVIASDRVTHEAKLINETEFLPLNKGLQTWVNSILQCTKGYARRNTRNEIVNAGYSVSDNIKVLERFYKKAIRQ